MLNKELSGVILPMNIMDLIAILDSQGRTTDPEFSGFQRCGLNHR